MFKKDRYSILTLALLFLLFSPVNNVLGINIFFGYIIQYFLVIILTAALLYYNQKLKDNRFLPLYLKSLKFTVLGYFLYILVKRIAALNFNEGKIELLNSMAEALPIIVSSMIMGIIPLLLFNLISVLIGSFYREKHKPKKISAADHLLENESI